MARTCQGVTRLVDNVCVTVRANVRSRLLRLGTYIARNGLITKNVVWMSQTIAVIANLVKLTALDKLKANGSF